MTKNLINDRVLNNIAIKLLRNWFVVTPKSKEEPEGDVWGKDTSLGTIDEVKSALINDIIEEIEWNKK